MIRFLASVRDPLEAEIALAAGADIIDLKEPSEGALGAVKRSVVVETVRGVAGRAEISATLGDLPMNPLIVADAVENGSSLGVDYLKLGLFSDGDPLGCLAALAARRRGPRLIIVLFADRMPAFDAIAAAASIGAYGIMLDTADKSSGSLLDHLEIETVARFVQAAKTRGLSVGLAGSLKPEHVPELLALGPDLLGFRGALCRGRARSGMLDEQACRAVRALIPQLQAGVAMRERMTLSDLPASALC
jgi:uncharacterized protein (UPF0264 family)